MRLPEGLFIDVEETFGELKFSALRRENLVNDDEGNATTELKNRAYDLKSKNQGKMIQVLISADAPLKDFPYDAVVELVNPTIGTTATPNYRGAEVSWYLKADDLVLKDEGKTGNKNGTAGNAGNTGNVNGSAGDAKTKDGKTGTPENGNLKK